MNILIPDSWLREFLDTNASPKDIQRCLSLCGPSVERMNKVGDDYIYDIEVTTNRVDCMSVFGIAREAVAILPEFGFTASLNPLKELKLTKGNIPGLQIINDASLNHRVMAIKLENVVVDSSPKWLQEKLEKIGLRTLNNLVDITNYVMWEVGHPCHVFDFDKLSAYMEFRQAKKGETLVTLDGQKHIMLGGEVVIVNKDNQIIDLPSIMGTANSMVTSHTKNALLFIDDVVSTKVRFSSMSHAIRTNAATLLEKDVDPQSSSIAMSRLVELSKKLLPEIIINPLLDIFPSSSISKPITIDYLLIQKNIGVNIPKEKINNIFKRLNFKITKNILTPPSYRSKDIQIPEDLVEEVARIYGYHNIPSVLMSGNLPEKLHDNTFSWEQKIKTSLKYLGFTEVYTYSLVNNDSVGLKLSNPLTTDWTELRTSLIPSHLKLISENFGKQDVLNFFEIADVYLPQKDQLPLEESHLIISSNSNNFPVFKGKIETFLDDLQIINLKLDLKFNNSIFIWEIKVKDLISHAKISKSYTPISKYMPLIEDFNINLTGNYSDLENKIRKTSTLINQIDLIDKYENKLTLRITFHDPSRQLTKADIAPLRPIFEAL